MRWSGKEYRPRKVYRERELDEWDAIARLRIEKFEPRCKADGHDFLALRDKGPQYKYEDGTGNWVTFALLDKRLTTGWRRSSMRLCFPSSNLNDERAVAEVLAVAVVELLQKHRKIYFYHDDPDALYGDCKIYRRLARIFGQNSALTIAPAPTKFEGWVVSANRVE